MIERVVMEGGVKCSPQKIPVARQPDLLLRYVGKLSPRQMSRLCDAALIQPVRPDGESAAASVALAAS
jgi:hypothetical protein